MILDSYALRGKIMKTIKGLNYIRAVSAIFIILYHYTTRYMQSFHNVTDSKIGVWGGCRAVAVFFILSGFLTAYNLKTADTSKSFAKKRLVRLYPAYWVAIILTTVVTYLFLRERFIGIPSTIFNFTMLQGFVGIPAVDGAYWTLTHELWFYVIAGALIFINKFIKSEKPFELFSTLWIFGIVCFEFIVSKVKIPGFIVTIGNIALLTKYASTFIIGISLSYIVKNSKNYLSYLNLILSFLLFFVKFGLDYTLIVVLIAFLVYIFAKKEITFKHDKIFMFIAGISYPLYLVHQMIGYAIIWNLEKLTGRLTATVTAFTVSIILAYLINKFIEKPVLKKFKKS